MESFHRIKKLSNPSLIAETCRMGEHVGRERIVEEEGIRDTPVNVLDFGSRVTARPSRGPLSFPFTYIPGSRVYGQNRNRTGGPRLLSLPA